MFEQITTLASRLNISIESLAVLGVGFGAMLAVFGLSTALFGRDRALERMAGQTRGPRGTTMDAGLLRHKPADPTGLMKTFIPQDRKQLTEVQHHLALAGYTGAHAVRNYYLCRIVLGILMPAAFLALIWSSQSGLVDLPQGMETAFAGLSRLRIFQIVMISVAVGFFGPAYWLKARANERRRAIEEAFPNALDLIQISVEAGLGFDAAMIRVGNEMQATAPAISEELLAAQREVQAGRSRDRALLDMAIRTGVDEVVAFVNVVLQSIQFGSPISGTLTAYAKEMRQHRELKAQEKANKLPVQMSAIMAILLLPALLLLTLGPVLIRYVRLMHG
jgi:tight adherence protein C